jgi:molybdopterin/thiamine biosynthesis adenylyltransferase
MRWLRFLHKKVQSQNEQRVRLVSTERDFQNLRAHLLRPDNLERAGFWLLGYARVGETLELYVHRALLPDDSQYARQGSAIVQPHPLYVLQTFRALIQSQAAGYLHAHSHPFTRHAQFSAIDDRYLPGMRKGLANYLRATGSEPHPYFVRLVCGQTETGFSAECFTLDGQRLGAISEWRIVGTQGIRHLSSSPREPLVPCEPLTERFDRNVRWLGGAGQETLARTHLGIVGAGGLGAFLLAYAVGLGFCEITLIDPDEVELTNLNRLIGLTHREIGLPKVDALARKLGTADHDLRLHPLQARIQDERAQKALLHCDVLLCGVDDDAARLEAQLLAARHLKPLLDLGSGVQLLPGERRVRAMGGQMRFYIPGGPCLVCQGLNPAGIVPSEIREAQRTIGYIQGTDEPLPSAITINGAMAALGMDTLVKYLTGFAPAATFLRLDLLNDQIHSLDFTSRPDCSICGEDGVQGAGCSTVAVARPDPAALRRHRMASATRLTRRPAVAIPVEQGD